MRFSEFGLTTLKEVPAEAEIVSHKLMLRAGLIRRLASGLFTWMPLGLRVLRKVEAVVREEMDRAGALELLMPAVQPAELWEKTGRWEQYGPLLLRMQDHAQGAGRLDRAAYHHHRAWHASLQGEPDAAWREQRVALALAEEVVL